MAVGQVYPLHLGMDLKYHVYVVDVRAMSDVKTLETPNVIPGWPKLACTLSVKVKNMEGQQCAMIFD